MIVGEGGIDTLFSTDHSRQGSGCSDLNGTCILIPSERKAFSYVFVIDQSSVGCVRRDILPRGSMGGSRFDARLSTRTAMAQQENRQEQDEHDHETGTDENESTGHHHGYLLVDALLIPQQVKAKIVSRDQSLRLSEIGHRQGDIDRRGDSRLLRFENHTSKRRIMTAIEQGSADCFHRLKRHLVVTGRTWYKMGALEVATKRDCY